MTVIHNPDDPLRDLYPTAREAFAAGQKRGEHDALLRARNEASAVSGKYESAADPAKFHCAEEICGRITRLMEVVGVEAEARLAEKH